MAISLEIHREDLLANAEGIIDGMGGTYAWAKAAEFMTYEEQQEAYADCQRAYREYMEVKFMFFLLHDPRSYR